MRVSPGRLDGAKVLLTAPRADEAATEPPRLWLHIAGAWTAAAVGVGLVGAGILWFLGFPEVSRPEEIPVSALDGIAARAFAVVAALSGIALLVIAYHRQRNNDQENLRARKAAEREDLKLFNDRFTDAYTALGDEQAAVRLGAVHALAHLADDAPGHALRQTCIDVLCAYLRMPSDPEPAPLAEDAPEERVEEHHTRLARFASFREVRHSIIRAIGTRFQSTDSPWQGHTFDLSGVVFDGGNLRRANFAHGHVNFNGARFVGGEFDLRYTRFTGATVSFRYAVFAGGTLNFRHARFEAGRADFSRARFQGSRVLFHDAGFDEGASLFAGTRLTAGSVEFAKDGLEAAHGSPPPGLLEAATGGTPGVAVLPQAWTRAEESVGVLPGE